jgi:hypothetical protein
MIMRIIVGFLALAVSCGCAHGESLKVDDFHWQDVEHVVAISDLHGDYEQYIKVLEASGLVNSRGKWIAGKTHLVQTGDVPDRGADTREILKHLAGLKKQAEKKGGMVHTLIGNHEAMNSYGDLRYVHPGEFQAFVTRNSSLIRDRQWEHQLDQLRNTSPEDFLLKTVDQLRLEWEKQVPLGWVEHRLAWQPGGEYGQWVLGNKIAVMVNDTIYLHGGLSPDYCHLSLEEITQQGMEQLQSYDRKVDGVLNAETGPLWYRGLAREDEDYFGPAVDQILERYGASRIVVGHTPTGGVVWPRFGARVVVNDTGIAKHYGATIGWLETQGEKAFAGYEQGKLELPLTTEGRIPYLEEVIRLQPENESLMKRLVEMTAPEVVIDPPQEAGSSEIVGEAIAVVPEREPISPGICLSGSS